MNNASNRHRRAAFTLIEMLLVIVIIMILVAILVPAVVNRSPGKVATERMFASLRQELESYYALYHAYPPSSHGGMSGSQCLYYFLTGPDGEGWKRSDGVPRGYTWKPSAFPGSWIADTGGKKFFWDGYGDEAKALLYYRADVTKKGKGYSQVYSSNDNSGPGEYGWSPSGDDWKNMICIDPDSSDKRPYNENSFILLSAGPDREFGFDGDRTDDLMNFQRRREAN